MGLAILAVCLMYATVALGSTRGARLPSALAQELGIVGSANVVEPEYGPHRIAAPLRVHSGANLQIDDFYVHIPPGAVEPLVPVLVLHGIDGGGKDFSEIVRARCDTEHWVIVAPTFRYGDWRDPAVLTRESAEHFPRINSFFDHLPTIAGMSVRPQTFVYGFSRGAQAANRYALAFPERVAGVAMMSAGTYTLPMISRVSDTGAQAVPFPYGVSNMQEVFGRPFDARAFAAVPFWVGVGGRDNDPGDVPRQWDSYVGRDRVERAQQFAAALQSAGVRTELQIFPGIGHAAPPEVNTAAMDFIAARD